MLNKIIARQVLNIGPDYRNHRGGIGAVIDSYSKQCKPFNFISTYKPLNKIFIFPYSIIQILKIFFYLIFNSKIKVIHIHGASRGSFFRKYIIFLYAKYLFNKKIIYHIHGGEFHLFFKNSRSFSKKLIKHFIENADIIICLSNKWLDYFSSNFNPKIIKILKNPVDENLSIKIVKDVKTKITFLFLGKLVTGKGIFDLLEVIKSLVNSGHGNFQFYIGGDGETKTVLDFIYNNKLNEIVFFQGWITGPQKAYILQESDIYVLPSYNEGLPVSILEAMNYSMPIISTKVGGIPELVESGENGFLMEPGDKETLKKYIVFFLENPDQIIKYGSISKEKIQDYYSENIMNELAQLYKQLL